MSEVPLYHPVRGNLAPGKHCARESRMRELDAPPTCTHNLTDEAPPASDSSWRNPD